MTPAQAPVQALNIPRGTLWSRYAQLYCAFFFLSIDHTVAGYMVGRTSGGMFTI